MKQHSICFDNAVMHQVRNRKELKATVVEITLQQKSSRKNIMEVKLVSNFSCEKLLQQKTVFETEILRNTSFYP